MQLHYYYEPPKRGRRPCPKQSSEASQAGPQNAPKRAQSNAQGPPRLGRARNWHHVAAGAVLRGSSWFVERQQNQSNRFIPRPLRVRRRNSRAPTDCLTHGAARRARGGLVGMACSHNSAAKCGKWVIIADIFPKLFYTRTALSVLLRRKHNENHHWLPSHAAKLSQTRSIGDTKREKMRTVELYIICPQRSPLFSSRSYAIKESYRHSGRLEYLIHNVFGTEKHRQQSEKL